MNEVRDTGSVSVYTGQASILTDSVIRGHMQEIQPSGMDGESMPYRLNNDWAITALLFLCFFLIYYSINHRRKYLYQRLKNFFVHKERGNLFDDAAGTDFNFILVLCGVTCVLGGVCMYDYSLDTSPALFQSVSSHGLLAAYIVSTGALVMYKWLSYSFVNWIFFDKEQNVSWRKAYFDLLVATGFLLFPLILLIVYFNLKPEISQMVILLVVLFTKILLFYKCIRNFFSYLHGFLHLILYFCTLEIIPDLLLWKGIEYVNKVLILNF